MREIAEVAAAEARRLAAPGLGMVLVLGSERSGPVAQWAQAQRVTIPQRRFDSLNVAMAGTVLAYELSRFMARCGRRSEAGTSRGRPSGPSAWKEEP